MREESPDPSGSPVDAPERREGRLRPPHHWTLHPVVVLGSLVLCFPIGFVLVWLTTWNTRSKILAAGAGMLLAVVLATSASFTLPWASP